MPRLTARVANQMPISPRGKVLTKSRYAREQAADEMMIKICKKYVKIKRITKSKIHSY